ncbi:Transcription factor [Schizosaccharomyces pombe]
MENLKSTSPEEDSPRHGDNMGKPKRIPRACDMCRKRKIRCDGKQPACSNCVSHGIPCVFTARPKRRTGQRQMYIKSLVSRLEQMESTLRSVIPNYDQQPDIIHPSSTPKNYHDQNCTKGETSSDDSTDDIAFLNEKMGTLVTTPIGSQKYFGSSSTFSIIQHAAKFASGVESDKVLEHLSMAKSGCLFDPDESFDGSKAELPSLEIANIYIDAYFKSYNPLFPVFTRENFYQKFGSPNCFKKPDGSIDLVNYASYVVVLSLGCLAIADTEEQVSRANALFKNTLGISIEVTKDMSFRTLVFNFLTSVYYCAVSKPNAVWLNVGVVVRVAQTLGLHRNSAMWSIGKEDAEEKARLFWYIYYLDRVSSMMTGKPVAFQDDDIDQMVPFYSIYCYYGLKPPEGDPLGTFNFLEAEVQLTRIVGQVLKELYSVSGMKSNSSQVMEKILEFDLLLNNWYNSLPDCMQPRNRFKIPKFCSSNLILTSAIYYSCLILIHRHSLTKNLQVNCVHRGTGSITDSQALCIAAARSITNLFVESADLQPLIMKIIMYHAFTSSIIIFISILKRPLASICSEDLNCLISVKNRLISFETHGFVRLNVVMDALESMISTAQAAMQKAKQIAINFSSNLATNEDVTNSGMPDIADVSQKSQSHVPPRISSNHSDTSVKSNSPSSIFDNSGYLNSLNNSILQMHQNLQNSSNTNDQYKFDSVQENELHANITPVLDQTMSMFPFKDQLDLNFAAANVYNPNVFDDMGLDCSFYGNGL